MSKRKGRRQPLTSEIKSVLRAPPGGELEPSQRPEDADVQVDEAVSREIPTSSEAAGGEAEAPPAGSAPASSEVVVDHAAASDAAASDAAASDVGAAATPPSERSDDAQPAGEAAQAAAPKRRSRRSRAVQVDTDTRADASPDGALPEVAPPEAVAPEAVAPEDSWPDAEHEPEAEATQDDFVAAVRAARAEQDDDDDGDSVTGERFAGPISFDDTGDDTEGFLRGLVEALLFTSQKPIDIKDLARSAGIDKPRARELIEQLQKSYEGRGLCIEEIAGGFVMRSSPRYAPYIHKILALKPVRLSRAQLETLAIVAYRQPVTKPEVDDIRGVDSGQVIKGLLERGLLKMLGKKDEPGHPTLYGTTNEFLELLNLHSLKDLPTLREYTELSEESQRKFMEATGETAPSDTLTFERPAASSTADGDAGAPPALDGESENSGHEQAFAAEPAQDDELPEASESYGAGARTQSDVVAIDDADLGDPEEVVGQAEADDADDDDDDDTAEPDPDEVGLEDVIRDEAADEAAPSADPDEDER